jgi:hypothetical protein
MNSQSTKTSHNSRLQKFVAIGSFSVFASLLWILPSATKASANPHIQCYRYDEQGQCVEVGQAWGELEAACASTARYDYCMQYFFNKCQQWGFQQACYMANLSQSNPDYFQQIINANRDCWTGNSQACAWIKQQGF